MERATGIGGVFVRSAHPDRLRAWYAEHLGAPREHENGRFAEAWTAMGTASSGSPSPVS